MTAWKRGMTESVSTVVFFFSGSCWLSYIFYGHTYRGKKYIYIYIIPKASEFLVFLFDCVSVISRFYTSIEGRSPWWLAPPKERTPCWAPRCACGSIIIYQTLIRYCLQQAGVYIFETRNLLFGFWLFLKFLGYRYHMPQELSLISLTGF